MQWNRKLRELVKLLMKEMHKKILKRLKKELRS
jgi:hypothetical protein